MGRGRYPDGRSRVDRRSPAERPARGPGSIRSGAAYLHYRRADLAIRAGSDPRPARARNTSLGPRTRSVVASYTARSKDRPHRWTRLAVATPLHLPDRPLAARAGRPRTVATRLHRIPERGPWQGLLPRSVGLVRSGGRFQ